MAGVDVSVVVTQRQNQIFDLVMQQQFDQFDGIACAGGEFLLGILVSHVVTLLFD
jgi:diacylglycerol kinase family enzyme